MRVVRETRISGAVIDQSIKVSHRHPGTRKPNRNITPETVQKHNSRLAVYKLSGKINANFFPGDYHLVLTYSGKEPSRDEAQHELQLFMSRMRREFQKIDEPFKWIVATEYKNHRIHHHLVMNYIDIEVVQKQWRRGMVRVTPLDRNRDYTELAEYIIKETEKTFRDPANSTKQRYSCSRNLVNPIIKREVVSERMLGADPKALKGYAIVEESIRRFEHPFTGLEHLEFRMVSTEYSPRLKVWRKGKKVKEESYRRAMAMKQLEMDFTNERSEWLM